MLDEALLELKQFCNTNSIAKDYVVDKPEGKSFTQTLHTLTKQLFATRKCQYTILQDEGSKNNSKNNQANPPKTPQSFDDKIEELKRLADTVCSHYGVEVKNEANKSGDNQNNASEKDTGQQDGNTYKINLDDESLRENTASGLVSSTAGGACTTKQQHSFNSKILSQKQSVKQ